MSIVPEKTEEVKKKKNNVLKKTYIVPQLNESWQAFELLGNKDNFLRKRNFKPGDKSVVSISIVLNTVAYLRKNSIIFSTSSKSSSLTSCSSKHSSNSKRAIVRLVTKQIGTSFGCVHCVHLVNNWRRRRFIRSDQVVN